MSQQNNPNPEETTAQRARRISDERYELMLIYEKTPFRQILRNFEYDIQELNDRIYYKDIYQFQAMELLWKKIDKYIAELEQTGLYEQIEIEISDKEKAISYTASVKLKGQDRFYSDNGKPVSDIWFRDWR